MGNLFSKLHEMPSARIWTDLGTSSRWRFLVKEVWQQDRVVVRLMKDGASWTGHGRNNPWPVCVGLALQGLPNTGGQCIECCFAMRFYPNWSASSVNCQVPVFWISSWTAVILSSGHPFVSLAIWARKSRASSMDGCGAKAFQEKAFMVKPCEFIQKSRLSNRIYGLTHL